MKNLLRGLAVLGAIYIFGDVQTASAQTFIIKGKMKYVSAGVVECRGGGKCAVVQIPHTYYREVPATVTVYENGTEDASHETVKWTWKIEPEYNEQPIEDGCILTFKVLD